MDLLPFAQIELAGGFPIADGRYLVRPRGEPGGTPDVLAVNTLGAARARSRLRRGKPAPVPGDPQPAPLPLTRLTLVKAIPFNSAADAEAWLQRVRGDRELAAGLAKEVALTVNRALEAQRVAAPNPYAADVDAGAAVAVRFGYGAGDEVAGGRWTAAAELTEKRRRGLRAQIVDGIGSQERVAAVLGGRDAIAPHESLLLDAERAHSEERHALAALYGRLALEAAAASGVDVAEAAAELRPLAEAATAGPAPNPEALRKALRKTRRAIRSGARA